ncbi:MAG: porin [Armatimonadota bacterium]|nr:porin [Armatimonadota bacterium]
MKTILTILLGITCAAVAQTQTPNDVPPGHWAYDAVRSLIERGYLEGYQDGSFLGKRPMTRYEMAVLIKRIIDDISSQIEDVRNQLQQSTAASQKSIGEPEPEHRSAVDSADLAKLQKLIEEFKPELAVIGARLDQIGAAMEQLDLRLSNVEGIVADPEGAFEAVKTDVSKLKKVTVGGYVQARFNLFRNDPDKSDAGTEPTDNFSIRRARLKITAKPTNSSSVVLQVDAGQGAKGDSGPSVSIKDAYLEYAFAGDPALGLMISMGQMKWPFGYSVVESSGVRECPERPLIVQRLFPGERDRGFLVSHPLMPKGMLVFKLGVFNGVETKFKCPNNNKALVGGLRAAIGEWEFGFSGFLGKGIIDDKGALYQQNEDRKTRWGVDFQYYGINNLALKAEWITGRGTDGIANAAALRDRISGGWAQLAYNLRRDTTFVARWETMSEDPKYVKYGRRTAWNIGLVRYLDDKTRLKVFYQINDEEKEEFKNNNLVCEWIASY